MNLFLDIQQFNDSYKVYSMPSWRQLLDSWKLMDRDGPWKVSMDRDGHHLMDTVKICENTAGVNAAVKSRIRGWCGQRSRHSQSL